MTPRFDPTAIVVLAATQFHERMSVRVDRRSIRRRLALAAFARRLRRFYGIPSGDAR